jgi:hypothetical protein
LDAAREERAIQPAPDNGQPRCPDAELAGEDEQQRQYRDPDEKARHDEFAD